MLALHTASWYYALMAKLHKGRRYDLWWEDPFKYAEHLKSSGEFQVYFTLTNTLRKRVDPYVFMKQNFHGYPWKAYINNGDSVNLVDYTCEPRQNKGSWPAWSAQTFDLTELKELIERPWSERDPHEMANWYHLPRKDQPHRIFIQDVSPSRSEIDINRRRRLTKIQRMYPEVEFFVKPRTFNMPMLFGCGFTAGCLDPYRERGLRKGVIYLPNGSRVHLEDIDDHQDKIRYFGFEPDEVRYDQDVGLLYTIAAIRYGAHHWDDPTGLYLGRPSDYRKGISSRRPDFQNPDMYAEMPSYQNINMFRKDSIKETDKIVCDSCALWRTCPAYRSEEVCGLPGTESSKLAKLAKSRNASDVVDMLSSVVSKQAERVEERMDNESSAPGGYDKEIDKMLNNLFKNGSQLAKLLDPGLGRPLVQINANVTPQQQVAQADPRALAAKVISDIEATGVPRDEIDEQMVSDYLSKLSPRKELEGEVLEAEYVNE
ncbi:putative small terminase subunit [Gordonia phage GMA7]|uniref:Putative small terminase subunit n=1 Tax=Gordonia phage GMA7 TaxID=1647286 RepID=A0A0K0N6S1_9CAUD|nr:terminase small subunit [Gordonia phage GMA7]AKJ72438.1 putative small terminase subunit [Gordonia phage GMA7]